MPFALVGTIDRSPVCHFLSEGRQTIGRSSSTDIHLDYPSVSRSHAAITVDGTRVVVEDLGSRSGTTVNGRPIFGPQPLHDGDCIGLGQMFPVLQFHRAPPQREAHARCAPQAEGRERVS